jgi:hypothetical protein
MTVELRKGDGGWGWTIINSKGEPVARRPAWGMNKRDAIQDLSWRVSRLQGGDDE